MTFKQALAAITLVAVASLMIPLRPALANGAASTRNIFLGAAAATYLIIEHNRKVHQRNAETAQANAAAQEQSNNGESAYQQEEHAYQEQVAANVALQKEVDYQHAVIKQQDQELAASGYAAPQGTGTMVSYGWGTL